MSQRLQDNLRALHRRIEAACARSGRPPGSVRLVAVTKTMPAAVCGELLALGQADLGESRAGSLAEKAAWCDEHAARPRWHFLGHLQRNKARAVVLRAEEIHSVDSLRLLEALERIAAEVGRRPGLYLELDYTAGEARTGLAPDEVGPALELARTLEHVDLLGLMTMAPPPVAGSSDPHAGAREVFERLARLRDELRSDAFRGGRARLSMGMSSDFEPAIEAGADVVRVGTALFEQLAPSEAPGAAEPGVGGGRA